MPNHIANIKITSQDIILNWWKLNGFSGGHILEPAPPQPTLIKYGALYNWYAASKNGGSGVGSIAPEGWHVPNSDELNELYLSAYSGRPLYIQEGKFVDNSGNYWLNSLNATNELNFNAKGAGSRLSNGAFDWIQERLLITSSNQVINQNVLLFSIYGNNVGIIIDPDYEFNTGCSILLIKDNSTDPGTMTDYDGNVYPTVKIGNQVWMAANLAVTHYNDGTPIPNVTDNTEWAALSTGAMCYYDNDINNK